jgi:predicted permease
MESLVQDIRHSWRMLAKSPGFTAVAVVTLALGIGANSAIFSLVDAVVLRTLPVRDPQQLVSVELKHADGGSADGFPVTVFQELQRQNDAVAGLIAVDGSLFSASVDGKSELIQGHFVSRDFYSVLGVSAKIGRTLTSEDDRLSGNPTSAVISYDYWNRRFNLDPTVIGKTIYLDRIPFTIVGVTPRGFLGVPPEQSSMISIPMVMHSKLALKDHTTVDVVARLKPGVSESQTRGRLTDLVRQIAGQQTTLASSPEERLDLLSQRVDLIPAGRGGVREFSLQLRILMAVVGVLLLIACVNIASLLLARSTVRRYEIATRLALGATRSRVIRQMLTESLLLASCGGGLGFLLSLWTFDLLPRLLSYDETPVHLNFRIVVFTAAVTIAAGVFFGIAPALRGTNLDLTSALKQGLGRAGGPHRSRLGRALVMAQVALSFVLLMSAGLFLRTLLKLNSVYPGFRREHILLASMYPTVLGYQGERELNLYRQIVDQVKTIPSVEAASLSRFHVLQGYWSRSVFPPASANQRRQTTLVSCNAVASEFFRTLGIPLLLGREFDGTETTKSSKVAVVSESFARKLFAGANPIGQTFQFDDQDGAVTVIGVVEDIRNRSLRGSDSDHPALASYVPMAQAPPEILGQVTLEIRATGEPAALTEAVRQRVQALDKDLAFRKVYTQASLIDESLSDERALAALTSGFGVVALLLSGIGLFGMTAYSVAQRTKEIGIRMALGAPRTNILRLVLREALVLMVVALGIGAVGAAMAGRLIATQLFGVEATDPLTIGVAVLLMTAVAGAASIVPVRRATKVDPMVALRYE